MRAKILTDEKVLLTQRNKTVGFWGSDFTVGWYGPGDIGAMDVMFLTPQNIENKKKGSWLPGTFYATNKRLIFEGDNVNKNKTINLDNVDSFELLSYGIDIVEEEKSKISIQRFKGLGEMNPDELWNTTLNPETRTLLQVQYSKDLKKDQNLIHTLMGNDVALRKDFIVSNAINVQNLDI